VLPFLVFTPKELSLVVHAPDQNHLRGARTARSDGRNLRKITATEKEGSKLRELQ
jgi:hypothetical protein